MDYTPVPDGYEVVKFELENDDQIYYAVVEEGSQSEMLDSMIQAFTRLHGEARPISGYELMPLNQSRLAKIPNFELLGDDFLQCDRKFNRIIANPPFSKNQDIDHIQNV